MTGHIFRSIMVVFIASILTAAFIQVVEAETLYEFYTNATRESLEKETGEMGRQLSSVFKEDSINNKQRKIDFSEYFSGLKKLVIYASKLASYSDYERDLQFARDNEVFKGLPENEEENSDNGPKPDPKDFASKKYDRMKTNVEEEIETYEDLIKLSLDSCESLAQNDLSGFTVDEDSRARIADFMKSDMFLEFVKKQPRFALRWPDLDSRLSAQFVLWKDTPPSPDSPIIDRKITGAI